MTDYIQGHQDIRELCDQEGMGEGIIESREAGDRREEARKLAGEKPLRYIFQMAAEYRAKHEELVQANHMREQEEQNQGKEEERPIDEEADQEPYREGTVGPPRSPVAFDEPPDWHIDDLVGLEERHIPRDIPEEVEGDRRELKKRKDGEGVKGDLDRGAGGGRCQ